MIQPIPAQQINPFKQTQKRLNRAKYYKPIQTNISDNAIPAKKKKLLKTAAILGATILAAVVAAKSHVIKSNYFLKTEDKRLLNLHTIDNKLLRGGAPSSLESFEALKEKGVKTIIDLRGSHSTPKEMLDLEKNIAIQNGITYKHLEMSAKKEPSKEQINTFFNIINNSNGKVYVHCKSGIDRTGILSALYEIKTKNLTPDQAYTNMKNNGYNKIHQFVAKPQKEFLFDQQKWQPILDQINVKTKV